MMTLSGLYRMAREHGEADRLAQEVRVRLPEGVTLMREFPTNPWHCFIACGDLVADANLRAIAKEVGVE